jgi:hypothetical protein
MEFGRSLWLALSLSAGIHIGLGLALIGISSEPIGIDGSGCALESCVFVENDEAAETGAAGPFHAGAETGGGNEEQHAEPEGAFRSIVTDLPPRVAVDEGASGGETAKGVVASSGNTKERGAGAGASHEKCVVYCGVAAKGKRVVYVIDRSLSMGLNGTFQQACKELLQSMVRLPADARFQVILYNRHAEPLHVNGGADFLAAETEFIDQASLLIRRTRPEGGTDHLQAIKAALRLHPDTIYLATDADDLNQETVDFVARCNKSKTVIHTIEVTRWLDSGRSALLRKLAEANGGTYHAVVVKSNPE